MEESEESEMIVSSLSISDQWNLHSIETISYLQEKLEPYETWIVKASVLGDNREAFTFFFPIIAGLRAELGARVLWAAILVEWSNLILKWIFKGDRPYWWIAETDLYSDENRPILRQFPNTCESGPGTPSGHLMMNTAIFYVILTGISSLFIWNSTKLSKSMKLMLSIVLYILYAAWIGVIFISRLYIQAHFIHQNILGIVIGLVVGRISWSSGWMVKLNTIWAGIVASVLFATSILTYIYFLSQGMDPLWTIPLALKHCIRTEYVKIDTQPYYLMMRFTGAALGLGLGVASQQYEIVKKSPSHFLRTVLGMKGGMLLGRMATFIQGQIPTDDLPMFLMLSLAVNVVLPYMVISVLPHFLLTVYPPHLSG